ncbi:hypothetical protein Btru_064807 [Bulinus truncatus]|nr:hypothetical protein Btru_064807 [Bulinus truncatus]
MAMINEKEMSGEKNVNANPDHHTLEIQKSGQPGDFSETPTEKKELSNKENKVKIEEDDEEEDEEIDVSCGIGFWRTNHFGRKFANLYVFATFMGISALCSSMVQSVIHVQLTSIEKQFNIDNSKAGLFDTVSRAGHMTTILFAGHFAKTVHIPVTIGLSGIFQGVLLATPAFLQFANPYELPILPPASHFSNSTNISSYGEQAKYMCDAHFMRSNETGHNKRPPITEETNQVAFIVILVVQAVKGITDTFHSGFLPTLYMDDNMVDKSRMSIFLGIQHIITDLASPVGRQLNGIMTEIPIDLKKTDMDPKDGRFVAAWWLAFLAFGCGLVVVSFPILLFPRKLISKKRQREALDKAVVTYAGSQVEEEIERPISDQLNVEDSLRLRNKRLAN